MMGRHHQTTTYQLMVAYVSALFQENKFLGGASDNGKSGGYGSKWTLGYCAQVEHGGMMVDGIQYLNTTKS